MEIVRERKRLEMLEIKVHYKAVSTIKGTRIACTGYPIFMYKNTPTKSKVNCGNCKRTKVFKNG